MTNDASATAEL